MGSGEVRICLRGGEEILGCLRDGEGGGWVEIEDGRCLMIQGKSMLKAKVGSLTQVTSS